MNDYSVAISYDLWLQPWGTESHTDNFNLTSGTNCLFCLSIQFKAIYARFVVRLIAQK